MKLIIKYLALIRSKSTSLIFPMSQQDKNNYNMTVKQLVETNLNAKTIK